MSEHAECLYHAWSCSSDNVGADETNPAASGSTACSSNLFCRLKKKPRVRTTLTMLTQNMSGVSYVADHSMRSAACAYGRGPMPTYTHLMQPAAAPCMNESAPLTGGLHGPNAHLPLPPPTLLTSSKPPTRREEDKEGMQESDDEKSGAEDKGRSEDYIFCGVDLKPVLPVALAVSTVIGGLCMLLVQIPMLSRFTFLDQVYLSASFAVLYVVVMGCMGYCAFIDPGQVKKTRNTKVGAMDIEEGMPRRAYKSWQYPRAIRRYDHYCKWLKNVIGLSNHREFVVTVGGLVLIAMLGIIVDLYLAVLIAEKGFLLSEFIVALHLGYSIALLAMAGPILKIHVGLISRNETAQEWKKKEHYVANNTTIGDNIPVEELDDDEYNDIFDRDAFVYDRTRNPFDNGRFTNCWNFWCQPRWPADAKGEF